MKYPGFFPAFLVLPLFMGITSARPYFQTIDAQFHTANNADAVCKIKVGEVAKLTTDLGGGDLIMQLDHYQARVEVLASIKGKLAGTLLINFNYPPAENLAQDKWLEGMYSRLQPGETCLALMKVTGTKYTLLEGPGKVPADPEIFAYDLGDEPAQKLLAEFCGGARSRDKQVQRTAIEQLGYLGEDCYKNLHNLNAIRFLLQEKDLRRAQAVVKEACHSADPILRGLAFCSGFQLNVNPGLEGPLEFMKLTVPAEESAPAWVEFDSRHPQIITLRRRLLRTLDETTRRSIPDPNTGQTMWKPDHSDIYRGVPGFDYARFYREVLSLPLVAQDLELRRECANVIWIRFEKSSVPEMIRLLDDPNSSIRQTGVSALRKCIHHDFSNSWDLQYLEKSAPMNLPERPLEERLAEYRTNEAAYLAYWRQWWGENKNQYLH